MANTEIEYMYRDGSNYKTWRTVVLEGVVASEQVERLRNRREEVFIPQQVGFDSLLTDWSSHYDDDHPWHEFIDIEATEAPITDDSQTAAEWAARFLAVEQWDPALAEEDYSEFMTSTPQGK